MQGFCPRLTKTKPNKSPANVGILITHSDPTKKYLD